MQPVKYSGPLVHQTEVNEAEGPVGYRRWSVTAAGVWVMVPLELVEGMNRRVGVHAVRPAVEDAVDLLMSSRDARNAIFIEMLDCQVVPFRLFMADWRKEGVERFCSEFGVPVERLVLCAVMLVYDGVMS